MLEVCPVFPDTSAKMTTPLVDSGDVASSRGSAGTATASHTINGSSAVNFLQPLVQFFVLNSLRKRVAVYRFSCRKFLIKILSSFEKNIFTLLADEKLKIIFIVVSAIFSIKYLISCNALCRIGDANASNPIIIRALCNNLEHLRFTR